MFKVSTVLAAIAAAQASIATVQSDDAIRTHFSQLLSNSSIKLTAAEKSEFFSNFKTLVLEGESADLDFLFNMARPSIIESEIAEVNSKASSWKAGKSSRFANVTLGDAKRLMGMISHKGEKIATSTPLIVDEELPVNYNVGTAHPECSNIVNHIRDQSNCGSCWAFATTEAFNDRLCLASKGEFQTLLSPQHTASCCNVFKCISFGCKGGMIPRAWAWFVREGVVSGGDYNDEETCWPYQIKPCKGSEHSTDPECQETAKTPVCRNSCLNENYPVPFEQDIHKAKNVYAIVGVEEIKKQILLNGPVSAGFDVKKDFLSYVGGIYEPTTEESLGGHAIKIVGWGKDETTGTEYWVCANSWSAAWGEEGFFRIKTGVVGIDESVVAGDVEYGTPVETLRF